MGPFRFSKGEFEVTFTDVESPISNTFKLLKVQFQACSELTLYSGPHLTEFDICRP